MDQLGLGFQYIVVSENSEGSGTMKDLDIDF